MEPDRETIQPIKKIRSDDVYLYEVAACNFNGKEDLYHRQGTTYVCSLSGSPAIINDDYEVIVTDRFTAIA